MKQIFVFMPFNPGDVVMALRFAQTLHSNQPDLAIDFITSSECLPLSENLPWLRHAIALPRKELRECFSASKNGENAVELLQRTLQPLIHYPYDLGINAFQGRWGAYLMPTLSAKRTIGLWPALGAGIQCRGNWCERWLAQPIDRQAFPIHYIDLFCRQTEALGMPCRNEAAKSHLWNPPPSPEPMVPTPRIALHPGTAWAGKQWPIQNWVRVAEQLLEAGVEVWVTGAPEEAHLVEPFNLLRTGHDAPDLHLLFGKTGWKDLISLYQTMDWVVSGDTVAMHVAASTGPKVLALFGASNPRETGPYGAGHFILETQTGPYPTQLAMAKDHPGLCAMTAESVTQFLLEGKPPSHGKLWETGWNSELRVQTLRDIHGREEKDDNLRFWLSEPKKECHSKITTNQYPPLLLQLKDKMEKARDKPVSQTLRELDMAEMEWAKASENSFVWEAYRIGIHGISMLNVRDHLELRQARFAQAIHEWQHFSAESIAE